MTIHRRTSRALQRAMTRRRWLSALGLGGAATLFSPMLRSLLATADGQDVDNRRFILCTGHNGVHVDYRPTGAGSDFDLTSWSALEPHRDDLLILEGFYHPFDLHLHGNWWPLIGDLGVDSGDTVPFAGGVSVDRFIAQGIGGESALSSLNLDVWLGRRGYDTESADGPERPYPASGPLETYDRVLSSIAGMDDGPDVGESPAEARLRQRRSLFDFLVDDIRRTEARLAGPERERLQQYVESVREMEMRLGRIADTAGTCSVPSLPDAERIGDDRNVVNPERIEASIAVLNTILSCGLTRVAVIQLTGPTMPFLGEDGEIGSHRMWHGDGTPEKHAAHNDFQARQVSAIWQNLKDTPEGDGSMADNSTLLWMNKSGGNHHNGAYDYWTMILGGAGQLRTGERIEMPFSPMENGDVRAAFGGDQGRRVPNDEAPVHSMNDLYATMAHVTGMPAAPFGDERISDGPIEALYR